MTAPLSNTAHPSGDIHTGPGAIVLAAFRPPQDLFRVQLQSIQRQSVGNFVCLISADGGADQVRKQVREAVGSDSRFKVIGFEQRLGFYHNFERALGHVPNGAKWIALSDQDDEWHENKLQRLLPYLESRSLVAAQSRVVSFPDRRVISEDTHRLNLDPRFFFIENQFTGGTCVFRREVLQCALPFPKLNSASQFHDHWLAACAASMLGAEVVDEVVQDYIQHGNNVIGEARRGFSLTRSLKSAAKLASRHEGSRTPLALLATVYSVGVGWREVMAQTLVERNPRSTVAQDLLLLFGPRRRSARTMQVVMQGLAAKAVSLRAGLEYLSGIVIGTVAPQIRRRVGSGI